MDRVAQETTKNAVEPVVQRRTTRVMAAATVGICLGSVAGVCTTLAANKWLHLLPGNINMRYLIIYYCVFLTAIAWAFLYGAARASIHILYLCACTSFAIPFSSLIAFTIPHLGIWWHSNTLGVDITALIAASLFTYAARVTYQRVHRASGQKSGQTHLDSVWTG